MNEAVARTADAVDAFINSSVPVEYNTEVGKLCSNGDLHYVLLFLFIFML